MTTVESRCKECLYLAEIEDEGDGRVAQCAIQSNVNPMLFSAEQLEAERHPQGICEDGAFFEGEDVCHAYHPKWVSTETLANHRREEMALIQQALWVLQLHKVGTRIL